MKISFPNLEKRINSVRTFTYIPEYKGRRIIGTENELGVVKEDLDHFKENAMGEHLTDVLPGFLVPNGGRIYQDNAHLEICTPETRNPIQTLIYEKAMELIALRRGYVDKIYKNNVDNNFDEIFDEQEISWGMHENYSFNEKYKWRKLSKLIPFLITRQIMTGAGWQRNDGTYEISQRSHFVNTIISDTATFNNRSIICKKNRREYEEIKDNEFRVHFILNEGNMCEGAILLKIGTLSLMLELLERNRLPRELGDYNRRYAVKDLKEISKHTSDWKLKGSIKYDALDIQKICLERSVNEFEGRDECTDFLHWLWYDTIKKLEKDPNELVGRVDWITKLFLFKSYKDRNPDVTNQRLQDFDLEYHNISKRGLFSQMQKAGIIEKYVSDELIEKAAKYAPQNTRAHGRSLLVKKIIKKPKDRRDNINIEWASISGINIDNVIDMRDPFHHYNNIIRSYNRAKRS